MATSEVLLIETRPHQRVYAIITEYSYKGDVFSWTSVEKCYVQCVMCSCVCMCLFQRCILGEMIKPNMS